MRFSLLQLLVGIAFVGTVLGLGVNNYRLSKELRTEQRYVYQLERFSSDLRDELSNAEKYTDELRIGHALQINAWTKSGELKPQPPRFRCGMFVPEPVNWKLLKEPVPQRGMRHPRYRYDFD